MTLALFLIAAGAGAALRHAVNQLGHGWRGTLAINTFGAFVLGLLSGTDADTVTVIGTGFLGSFTTFSTFMLEAVDARARERWSILVASLAVGIAAAFAGVALS